MDKFIYLNQTCFGGLYSVNKKNEFIESFGRSKNHVIYDEDIILSLSQLFSLFDVHFKVCDHMNGVRNHIVYHSVASFDPLYFKSFDKYSKQDFCDTKYIKVLN